MLPRGHRSKFLLFTAAAATFGMAMWAYSRDHLSVYCFLPMKNDNSRISKAFPAEILDWIRLLSLHQVTLVLLEPQSVQCLGEPTGESCPSSSMMGRFRFAVAADNHSDNAITLSGIVSQSMQLGWKSSYTTNQQRFVELNKRNITLLLSALEFRPKYWYVHGSLANQPGIQEPPRAFLGLKLKSYPWNGRTLLVPHPPDVYLRQWPKSQFLECNRTSAAYLRLKHPKMYQGPSVIKDSFVNVLAYCRDLFAIYGMTLMLSCGTALGWYRECGIIPHTSDMDFIFLASEWKPEMENVLKNDRFVNLITIFGKAEDSLEMAVVKDMVKIDIFALYEDGNQTYMSGLIALNKTKIRWYFPKFTTACTCDLKGELFHVRCDVVAALEAEYGPEWYEHHFSTNFSWLTSHRNKKLAGKYSDSEWPTVFRLFY